MKPVLPKTMELREQTKRYRYNSLILYPATTGKAPLRLIIEQNETNFIVLVQKSEINSLQTSIKLHGN